jgi:hypothetical protein
LVNIEKKKNQIYECPGVPFSLQKWIINT